MEIPLILPSASVMRQRLPPPLAHFFVSQANVVAVDAKPHHICCGTLGAARPATVVVVLQNLAQAHWIRAHTCLDARSVCRLNRDE